MEIFSDKFGRCIWLKVSSAEIRMDLQDLNPDSEYERCATVHDVEEVCMALEVDFKNLESKLHRMVKNKKNAFDLFTDFLNLHKIKYDYYSGWR